MTAARAIREALPRAKRVVVKVGTRVLVQRSGRPDEGRIAELVRQLAGLRDEGREVVLVSSGAIGAGVEALGLRRRPSTLPELQMAAAVGQSRLMARYDRLFSRHGRAVGQVLLTHDVLKDRVRHLNARNAMLQLLRHGIVPVVNENDVVSVDEIRFGDNDQLAALVTILVEADLLLLLSTTNGLREGQRSPGATRRTRRVPYLPRVEAGTLELAWGRGSELSSGGMRSKLLAAQTAADVGAAVVIADGRRPGAVERVLAGEDTGTLIGQLPSEGDRRAHLPSRKRWIAFFQRVQGALVVDAGARAALLERGKSLLPAGVRAVERRFGVGALVAIKDEQGRQLARGLVDYSSDEIARIKGHRTGEIAALLGAKPYDAVIHRDNMVVFDGERRAPR